MIVHEHEHPALELEIVDTVSGDDIEIGIVEQVDQTSDTDNRQRLDREDRKDQGQNDLVDTIGAVRAMVHIEEIG